MNLDVKNVRTQANTGVAGRKNCEVKGMMIDIVYNTGIPSLMKMGCFMIVNQKEARRT